MSIIDHNWLNQNIKMISEWLFDTEAEIIAADYITF